MPAPDRAALLAFLRKHRLGVLSTVSPEGKPEAAVVGIAISDDLEIVFDTLDTTRKIRNLRRSRNIAFVIGGDEEITVQIEGVADEPHGAELARLKLTYFSVWPECREHEKWPHITWVRVRPHWFRYSDFNAGGGIFEFTKDQL
jgi:general stress protein 26